MRTLMLVFALLSAFEYIMPEPLNEYPLRIEIASYARLNMGDV